MSGYILDMVIPGVPVAMPRPKVTGTSGKPRLYVPLSYKSASGERVSTGVKEFREAVRLFVLANYRGAVVDRPVAVHRYYNFPRHPAKIWKRKSMVPYRHSTKPDIDNLDKMLFDALTLAGIWIDDSRVCAGFAEKWHIGYDQVPCTRVTIQDP